MTKSTALARELDRLVKAGHRVPCAGCPDGELWLSELQSERQIAATFCEMCPVIELCREAADERKERWYVCGGVNYRNPRNQKARILRNRERKAA